MKSQSRLLHQAQSLFISVSCGLALPALTATDLAAATTSTFTQTAPSLTVTTDGTTANLVMSGGTYFVGQLVNLPAIGGITAGNYYITSVSGTTIQVSATPGGTAITSTSAATSSAATTYYFNEWADSSKWSASFNSNSLLASFGNTPTGLKGVSVSGNQTLYGLTYNGAGNADLDISGGANGVAVGSLTWATDDATAPVITQNGSARLANFGSSKVINFAGTQGLHFLAGPQTGSFTGSGLTAIAGAPAKNTRLTNVTWTGFSGGVTVDRGELGGQTINQLGTTTTIQDLTVGTAYSITNNQLAGFSMGSADQSVGRLNGNSLGRIWGGASVRNLTIGSNNATAGDFAGIIGQNFAGTTASLAINLIKTGTGTQTVSGLIKGIGTVNANGGILNLNNANPYIGVTTVNTGGTLVLGANDALGSGGISPLSQGRGNVLVKTGGVLDLNGKIVAEQIDLQGGTLKTSATGAGVTNGLVGISFTAAGSGLTMGSAVLISGGGGTGAAATACFGPPTGLATATGSLTIDAAGSGYTTAPTVVFTGGNGLGMTATATVSGGLVTDINITNSGFGYTNLPTISFTGGGGTGAAATLVSTKCVLTGIQVTNPGSDYTTAPTVSIAGDGSETQPTISDRAIGGVVLSQNSSLQDDANLTLVSVTASTSNKTLTKLGTGTLTLSGTGDNAFIALDAQAGTVLLDKEVAGRAASLVTLNGANASLPTAGANNKQVNTLVVNSGTFDLNGQSSLKSTVTSFSGAGGIVTNNGAADSTLFIGDGGGVYTDVLTYSGVIRDGITNTTSVTVQGGATSTREVILSGANTYTGDTTVTSGKLTLKSPYLANTSSVTVGTSGNLNLDYAGTDTVTSLTYGGNTYSTGTFGSSASAAATKDDTYFSGTGYITVIVPTGYAGWKGANAGGQTADLDYDLDGVKNGVEYFMNAPAGFTANPSVVVSGATRTVTWTNGGNISASDYGTRFVVQTSTDLVNWADVAVGGLTTNTGSVGTPGVLTYTLAGTGKSFVRLKVTPN